jgi:hypothetical protein
VIAHEATHGVLRRHFGRLAMVGKPRWLEEGYCDYVADESTLSAEDGAAPERAGQHPVGSPICADGKESRRNLRPMAAM